MTINCYKKSFISEINAALSGANVNTNVTRTIMKSSVLGIITAIKKFSRKTVYSVDDGTGTLDCVLWHDESAAMKKIDGLRMKLDSQNVMLDKEAISTCHLLLNKVEVSEEETNYNHADRICCLGNIKLVKGKLLLDISHHYKINDVNSETLWNLDVLASRER